MNYAVYHPPACVLKLFGVPIVMEVNGSCMYVFMPHRKREKWLSAKGEFLKHENCKNSLFSLRIIMSVPVFFFFFRIFGAANNSAMVLRKI